MEAVTDFLFLGFKITADIDYSCKTKRHMLLGRKAITNIDSILKTRDITLSTKVRISSVQFSRSVMSYSFQPMDCSTPGLPVHHQLPELIQTHVHRVGDAIQLSHPVVPFSSCPQSFPASGSFPVSQFFASSGQGIGVSASTSVLPMNIQV